MARRRLQKEVRPRRMQNEVGPRRMQHCLDENNENLFSCIPEGLIKRMLTAVAIERKEELSVYSMSWEEAYRELDARVFHGLPEQAWPTFIYQQRTPETKALDELQYGSKIENLFKPICSNQDAPNRSDFKNDWLDGHALRENFRRRNHSQFFVSEPSAAGLITIWICRKERTTEPPLPFYAGIFNTVPGNGSHWVATVFDAREKRAEFFDSLGHPPNGGVNTQFQALKTRMALLHRQDPNSWINVYSDTTFQMDANQCGVYSLWYILERASGRTSSDVLGQLANLKRSGPHKPDTFMKQMRLRFFTQPLPETQQLLQEGFKAFQQAAPPVYDSKAKALGVGS